MIFPIKYKCLKKNYFEKNDFKIVPIRFEDRLDILKWRNEQIFHLRQNKFLTENEQNMYFETVVVKLFEQEQPNQLLFSFLRNEVCIGYGGLVHINWIDKNAEISFLMNTSHQEDRFETYWGIFLKLIEEVAFNELQLHKIFTYAFDLRPNLYDILEKNNFIKEAILKEHCLINNKYIDVIIHTKIKTEITFQKATEGYEEVTYEWASNPIIRKYSFSSNLVTRLEHHNWFNKKLVDRDCYYYIAKIKQYNIGSIRFDVHNNEAVVSYLIDVNFHGKGIGKLLLNEGINKLLNETTIKSVIGLVFKENIASLKAFRDLNFEESELDNSTIKFSKTWI